MKKIMFINTLVYCAGAEERFWHLKHFCCYECDSPLAGHKYIPVEGQPHCLSCWQSKHGKVGIWQSKHGKVGSGSPSTAR